MPFRLAQLFVEVGADDKPLDGTLSAVRQKLAGLARTKFNVPGGSFATVLGLGGAGLGLKSIVGDAVTMESKMVALSKATDLEGAALAAMKSEILRLSTTLKGVRINDLLDIATAGAKLGVAAGDLAAYTEGVAKVASAMDDMPAGVIAEEIGKLNSVFKLGVQGTLQFGSAIDKLADSGVSSASGILNVVQRISGAAVAAKITAQESTALAAALLDTGTNAELGATSLTKLIAALNSPDLNERKNFAKTIGVDIKAFGEMVDKKPIEAIKRFLSAVKGMDAKSQQTAIGAIGIEGVHGIGEVQKLAQQVATLDRYVGLANSEFRTLDQMNKSYNATATTTEAKLAAMRNQLQILGDRVGGALLPAVNAGLALVGELATGLGNMWAGASSSVASWGVDFSGVLEAVGFGLRNMGDIFAIVGTRIGGGFVEAWGLLSYGGEVVAAVAGYIGNEMAAAMDAVVGAALNAKDNIVSIFTAIWEYIRSGFKDPIEFKLKGIMEGAKIRDEVAFAMPKRDLSGADVDNQIRAIEERIAAREAARDAGNKTGANGAVPGRPGGAGAGGANFTPAGGAATRVGVTDVDSYARKLTEGALNGEGKVAQSQLKVAESMDQTLKAIQKNTEKFDPRNGHESSWA